MIAGAVIAYKLCMASLLTAFAELDRVAAFHTLLYEPIVISTIVGWVLGEPSLGLKIGVIVELIFLGSISVGGSMPPDPTLPAAAAAFAGAVNIEKARVSFGEALAEPALIALVITLCMPLASVGRMVERGIKEANVSLAHDADRMAGEKGRKGSIIGMLVLKSMGRFWGAYLLVSLIALAVTGMACKYLIDGGGDLMVALSSFYLIIPLIALGSALASIRINGARVAFVMLGLAITRF